MCRGQGWCGELDCFGQKFAVREEEAIYLPASYQKGPSTSHSIPGGLLFWVSFLFVLRKCFMSVA